MWTWPQEWNEVTQAVRCGSCEKTWVNGQTMVETVQTQQIQDWEMEWKIPIDKKVGLFLLQILILTQLVRANLQYDFYILRIP